jgi:triacylglycerol lipase
MNEASFEPSLGARRLPVARTPAELVELHAPKRDREYFAGAETRPFRRKALRFDVAAAWRLAEASLLAYVDDPAFVEERLSKIGARRVATYGFGARGPRAQAIAAAFEDHSLLVFRGTDPDDPREWIGNLDVRLAPWRGGGRVHSGFLAALEADDFLQRVLEEARRPDAAWPLWIAGHSLGGALATLVARRLVDEEAAPFKMLRVATFGSPRAGDADFVRGYRPRTWRVLSGRDPVPRLPPSAFGYRHVVSEVRDRDGAIVRTVKTKAEDAPDRGGAAASAAAALLEPLSDHAAVVYADALWNASRGV